MASVRFSLREDNRVNEPRKCIDRLVTDFISNSPLDAKVVEDYKRCRLTADNCVRHELDLILNQVETAYRLREQLQEGRMHSKTYSAAIAPLLHYAASIDVGSKAA